MVVVVQTCLYLSSRPYQAIRTLHPTLCLHRQAPLRQVWYVFELLLAVFYSGLNSLLA